MHWLTKILVVFAAVLSILLAALSIAYSTNATRITGQFRQAREDASAARTALSAEQAANSSLSASFQTQIDTLEQQIRELRAEKESFQRDNSRLLADAKTAEMAALTIQARIDQLAATSQTQAQLIETMYSEVAKLRENELLYAQREIQLSDRLNDLNGQLEVATETNRALQERLADLQRTMDASAGRATAGAPGSAGTSPSLAGYIRARITDVRRDPSSGAMLAQIDAGSADRIQQGMELGISQGGKFVGKLMVQTVDLNNAVGRIETLGRQVEVKTGDMVWATR